MLAEYALRDLQKPIGIADYVTHLVETLPEPFRDAVPSVTAIEEEWSDGEVGQDGAEPDPTP
ncbi:MAG: hypothetical protein EA400_15200 [Chromatiaceae bacterium]|nr:MAG: hypothetical protein EA400_15200 [Chromatiaceae bacterium]